MIKKLLVLLFTVPAIWAMERPQKKESSLVRTILYLTQNKWNKDTKKHFLYWYTAIRIDAAQSLKEVDALHKDLLEIDNECRQAAKQTVDLPLNVYPFEKSLTTHGPEYLKTLMGTKNLSPVDELCGNKVRIFLRIDKRLKELVVHHKEFDALNRGINDRDSKGNTPLDYVLGWDDIELAKLLLENGAQVDAQSKNGDTPLSYTASFGKVACAQLLISKGANVNSKNVHGYTPLHGTAFRGPAEITKLLLEKGAFINALAGDNRTPLHNAAFHGTIDVVEVLLENGADINLRDKDGETALTVAKKRHSSNFWNNNMADAHLWNARTYVNDKEMRTKLKISTCALVVAVLEKAHKNQETKKQSVKEN